MILYIQIGDLLSDEAEKKEAVGTTQKEETEKKITEGKKRILEVIEELKRLRRRLAYKQSEYDAIQRLWEMTPHNSNLYKLRRMRSRLEFRIATEAATLVKEKEMIKTLAEISEELEEASTTERLKKKSEFVMKDIEGISKRIEEMETKLKEEDAKLDSLYATIRERTGARRATATGKREKHIKHEEKLELNIEDLATIKSKRQESPVQAN